MELWRICKKKYAASAFSGVGAEKTGGRWNCKGHPVVYTSENLSLATLELFVHVPPPMIPNDLIAICAQIPNSVSQEFIEIPDLPKNWQQYPASSKLQDIGTDWIERGSALVLKVPSAINPRESNLLLNPAHPEMKKLKVIAEQPFKFDPRMFK
ncbi:MAG: hypothetical protein COA78_12260 [Blastopirellula sp.]|nr:MAG: hypothetical protein COA78_12260 [Blastopirellula sp.]